MKLNTIGWLVFMSIFAMATAAQAEPFSLDEADYVSNRTLKIEGDIVVPDRPKWSAVIVLHGCDGITRWSKPVLEEHAAFYRARGFATITLDSWTPRHLQNRNMCAASSDDLPYLDPVIRVVDVETVAAHLATLPGFNGKIILDGLSHGGWVALSALTEVGDTPLQGKVAGIVAWYPACGDIDPTNKVPTLIFAGGKDANPYTAPAVCVEAAKKYDWVETDLFENATHAFDYPYTAQVAGASGLIRYDSAAKDAAYKRLDSWLREKDLTQP